MCWFKKLLDELNAPEVGSGWQRIGDLSLTGFHYEKTEISLAFVGCVRQHSDYLGNLRRIVAGVADRR